MVQGLTIAFTKQIATIVKAFSRFILGRKFVQTILGQLKLLRLMITGTFNAKVIQPIVGFFSRIGGALKGVGVKFAKLNPEVMKGINALKNFGSNVKGGFFGFILAALVVTFRVDQIIAGVAINIFVLGITSFLTSHLLKSNPELNDAPVFKSINLPILSDIPVLGPVLFKQNIFVYFSIFIVIISTYYLFKTAYGLRARAVGEHPKAAETLGISVLKTRFHHVIMGGMIAGFGGAWFTLGSVGRFDEGMTGGRGFIGLAAMIFGRWHPVGALFAALIFGFADSLQQKLAILRTPIPSEFLAMAPYLVTIIVVAGIVGNIQANEVLKYILQLNNNLEGNLLIIDLLDLSFKKVKFSKKKNCVCAEL